jgi:hypothetical protein
MAGAGVAVSRRPFLAPGPNHHDHLSLGARRVRASPTTSREVAVPRAAVHYA